MQVFAEFYEVDYSLPSPTLIGFFVLPQSLINELLLHHSGQFIEDLLH
jgi:hypothetical protein